MMRTKTTAGAIAATLVLLFSPSGGRAAAGQSIRLTVPNLACAQGSYAVQDALAPLPGVTRVEDDVMEHTVTVDFDSAKTTEQTIRNALDRIKYPAEGKTEVLVR